MNFADIYKIEKELCTIRELLGDIKAQGAPDAPEAVERPGNREVAADIIREAMEAAAGDFIRVQDKLSSPVMVLAFMQETYAPLLSKLADALAKVDPATQIRPVVDVDGREVFEAVIADCDRAVKRTGSSPIMADTGRMVGRG